MNANQQMYHRLAIAIQNGNVSRILKWDKARCEQMAREALEATEYKSLAAAKRYLDSKKVEYDL